MTDGMPDWVCAIGGYEFLLSQDPNIVPAAQEWLRRFGPTHPYVHGTNLNVARHRDAYHYGIMWWADHYEMGT